MATILGKKLMLFVKEGNVYKTLAYATNHTFTTSASTVSIASKDDFDVAEGGKWDSQELDMFSWSITSENLYNYDGNGMTSDDIMNMYLNGKEVEVKFGLAETATVKEPNNFTTTGWKDSATQKFCHGKAYITSLDINASNDGRATMSITLTGKGAINYGLTQDMQ